MKTITIDGVEYNLLPKVGFKAGDWVVIDNCNKSTYQVDSVREYDYTLKHTHGGLMPFPFSSNERLRLWSREDAKCGDVLYSLDSKQPFIYKERPQYSQARGYCCINKFGDFAVWNTNKCIICTDKYIPATEEQRDLLFAKMKEAGYEWDAENKELMKIKPHYDISNFNPFDKVLVRQDDSCTWGMSFFGRYDGMFICCSNVCFAQCIPFNDDTKHLLGTTDMCDEMYINW